MAEKKFYVGTFGPFIFDNTDPVDDPDGDFAGENYHSFTSDEQMYITEDPTDDYHVLRLKDLKGIWPIGSVFLAVVSTNPNTLLGFGTWVQIAQGQFLVGFKTGDPDFGVVEGTGGNKNHTHPVDPPNTFSGGPSGTTEVDTNLDGTTDDVASDGHDHSVDIASFNSGDNSTLPPYFTLYVWKRTA
jgi:hypothetical protein